MSDKTVLDEIYEHVEKAANPILSARAGTHAQVAAFELSKAQALELMQIFAEQQTVADANYAIRRALKLAEKGNYAPIARMINEGLEFAGVKLKASWGVVRDWYSESIDELKDCAQRMGNDPEGVFYLQDGDCYMARLTDWR